MAVTDLGTVSYVLAMLLCAGALAILVPLYRARHDRVLQLLAVVLLLTAVPRVVPIEVTRASGVGTLLFNLLGIAAGFYLMAFFRAALHAEGPDGRPPSVRVERAVALAVGVTATAAWAVAPAGMRSDLASLRNLPHPAALVFDVVVVGYLTSVSGRAAWWSARLLWSVRRSERRDGDPDPSTRVARGGFLLGVAAMGLAEAARFVADVVKFVWIWVTALDPALAADGDVVRQYTDLFIRFSKIVFMVGVLLPLVVDAARSLLVLRARRRDHATLEPMWRALVAAFPALEFRGASGFYSRHYRRDVEIRDCMLLLRDFYDGDVAERARRSAPPGSDREAVVVAELVRGALDARERGLRPSEPHPVPASGAATREQDVAWLVRAADAFGRPSADRRVGSSVRDG